MELNGKNKTLPVSAVFIRRDVTYILFIVVYFFLSLAAKCDGKTKMVDVKDILIGRILWPKYLFTSNIRIHKLNIGIKWITSIFIKQFVHI